MSIYQDKKFWWGLLDRAIRTFGQSLAAGSAASIFTGSGLLAFGVVVGVAVLTSVGTSLAFPEKVIAGEIVITPKRETEQVS